MKNHDSLKHRFLGFSKRVKLAQSQETAFIKWLDGSGIIRKQSGRSKIGLTYSPQICDRIMLLRACYNWLLSLLGSVMRKV